MADKLLDDRPKLIDDRIATFEEAFEFLESNEGKDPDISGVGGRGSSIQGVTQDTFNSFRKQKGLPEKDILTSDEQERKDLLREDLFERTKIDKLPRDFAITTFDFAAQSGEDDAIPALQKSLGVEPDGLIGPKTIKAAEDAMSEGRGKEVLQDFTEKREKFLRKTKTFKDNPDLQKGLINRIDNVRDRFDLNLLNPFAAKEAEAAEGEDDITQKETPILERLSKSFAAGVVGTVEGVAGSLQAFGGIEQKVAGALFEYQSIRAKESISVSDPKFIDQVAAGFGSMTTFLIPGMGVAKGVKAMQYFPRLAAWLGVSTSSALEATVEAGSTYNRAKEKGEEEEGAKSAATKAFWMNLPTLVFTNKLGLFADKGGAFLKGLKSAPLESVQEFTQSLIGNAVVNDPLMQGALESAAVGGIVGGGAGLAVGAVESLSQAKELKDEIGLDERIDLTKDSSETKKDEEQESSESQTLQKFLPKSKSEIVAGTQGKDVPQPIQVSHSQPDFTTDTEINKGKNKLNSSEIKDPPNPLSDQDSSEGKFELPDETSFGAFRRTIEDYNLRIKALVNEIEKTAGVERIDENLDLWAMKDMLPRKTSDAVRRVRDEKIEFVKQLTKDGFDVESVDAYLHATHAKERNAMMNKQRTEKGEETAEGLSGMTDLEADEILAKAPKEFANYRKDVNEFNEQLIDFQVEAGLITPEDAELLKTNYENYVPLFRDVEDGSLGIGIGSDIRGSEIKRAKGSFRRVLSPLGNMFYQRERAITRALKNEIGNSIIDITKEHTFMKDFFKVEAQKHVPRFNAEGELQFLDPQFQLAENIIGTKVKGKQFFITVEDPGVARALKNLNLVRVPKFVNFMRGAIGIWSSMKTRWRPEFLITNFQRDLGEALVNLGVEKEIIGKEAKNLRTDIVKDLFPSQRQVWSYIRGQVEDPVIDEFFKLGGDVGHFWIENAKSAEKSLEKLQREIKGAGIERVLNPGRTALQLVDDINSMVELGVRYSTYKQLIARGMSKQRSVQASSDLTINFARQGEIAPILKAFYGFINPAIQGASKVIRSTTDPQGAKRVGKGIAMLTGLGFFTRMLSVMLDEEGDEQINPWAKNHKMVFSIGGGKEISLWQMPYGYTTFFSMGSNLAEVMLGKITITEALGHVTETSIDSFSPFGTTLNDFVPTLARPIFDVNQNKAWHGGRVRPEQIYTRTPKPNSETYFRNTAQSYITTTKFMNNITGGKDGKSGIIDVSPNDLQYLYDQYFGGPFEFVTSTIETAARGVSGEFNPNETPFVRKFFREGKPDAWAYSTIYDTLRTARRTKTGDLEKERFFRAINLGLMENIFDQRKADGFVKDFMKGTYGIEGAIDSPIAINRIRQMPVRDRDILLNSYTSKTEKSIRNKLGVSSRRLIDDR